MGKWLRHSSQSGRFQHQMTRDRIQLLAIFIKNIYFLITVEKTKNKKKTLKASYMTGNKD